MVDTDRLRAFRDTVHFTQICVERGNLQLAKEQYCQLTAMYAEMQSSNISHADKTRSHAALSELYFALANKGGSIEDFEKPIKKCQSTQRRDLNPLGNRGYSNLSIGTAQKENLNSRFGTPEPPFPGLPTSLPPSVLPPSNPPSLAPQDSHHAAFVFGAFVIFVMLGSSVFLEPTLTGLVSADTLDFSDSAANQPPLWLKDEILAKGTTMVNLQQYVIDPDGDAMIFEVATEGSEITATLNNSILTLTPARQGTFFVVVTASDLKSIRRSRLRVISS